MRRRPTSFAEAADSIKPPAFHADQFEATIMTGGFLADSRPYDEAVRSRVWAAGAFVWTVVFIVLAYVKFDPQVWYVVLVGIAGLLALFAATAGTDGRGRTALLFAMGIMVVAAVLGGFKAGPVLLPGIISCALGVKNSASNLQASS